VKARSRRPLVDLRNADDAFTGEVSTEYGLLAESVRIPMNLLGDYRLRKEARWMTAAVTRRRDFSFDALKKQSPFYLHYRHSSKRKERRPDIKSLR